MQGTAGIRETVEAENDDRYFGCRNGRLFVEMLSAVSFDLVNVEGVND